MISNDINQIPVPDLELSIKKYIQFKGTSINGSECINFVIHNRLPVVSVKGAIRLGKK